MNVKSAEPAAALAAHITEDDPRSLPLHRRLLEWARDWQPLLWIAVALVSVVLFFVGITDSLGDVEQSIERFEGTMERQEAYLGDKIDKQSELFTEKIGHVHDNVGHVEEKVDGVSRRLQGLETDVEHVEETVDDVDRRLEGLETKLAVEERDDRQRRGKSVTMPVSAEAVCT